MADTLRFLAASMVHEARSGHPGMPLGMADVAAVLWSDYIVWKPKWDNRDRFILSCGHGSALLYSILCCMGQLTVEDCKSFRRIGSKVPGHPELNHDLGIEMTTGPLGQGLAWGIGMSYAKNTLSNLDHYTYIFCSDGDLMEGIAHESLQLATLWNCKKCIVFWDNNSITIDGSTACSSKTAIESIFHCHGWNVINIDGHDYDEIKNAIEKARNNHGPTCINCRTIIGYGSSVAGTAAAHGAPLQDYEDFCSKLGLNYDNLPLHLWNDSIERGNNAERAWNQSNQGAKSNCAPDYYEIYKSNQHLVKSNMSTRALIPLVIDHDESLLVGSADLGESTCTIQHNNYIHFGVREHAMVATSGGMILAGARAACATFLVFFDYARPAIRLASMMHVPLILIATHDSIGLGEDGPTHQPVEQLNSYRIMPNIYVWRPANYEEMVASWIWAAKSQDPTLISCTRQSIPMFKSNIDLALQGAYIVKDGSDLTILSSGSELHLAINISDALALSNLSARVVSVPCLDLFMLNQLHKSLCIGKVVSIEAGSTVIWSKYADLAIGIDDYGASGSSNDVLYTYGFDKEKICNLIIKTFGFT